MLGLALSGLLICNVVVLYAARRMRVKPSLRSGKPAKAGPANGIEIIRANEVDQMKFRGRGVGGETLEVARASARCA